MPTQSKLIAVAHDTHAQLAPALALAANLQLPHVANSCTDYAFLLVQTAEQLMLLKTSTQQQLAVDFLDPSMTYRRHSGRRELLAKACRVKGKSPLRIIDATAGLGRDAFVLANQGHQLILLERSAVVAALLADGIARLSRSYPDLAKQMILYQQDAKAYLMRNSPGADIVYLDPLFPERHKTALVKKPMQLLQQLLVADSDAAELLALARQTARYRVVVKRPRAAPPLADQAADLALVGRSCRFDIYLCNPGQVK